MITLLITEKEFKKAQSLFGSVPGFTCIPAPANEELLADVASRLGAQHAIVGTAPYTDKIFKALPRGGVLARFGVGHERIDKRAATSAGILCTNTPGVLADSVAELTIALMLAAARHLPRNAVAVLNGLWPSILGTELSGKSLAIIGCGSIGKRVAQIAARGFGMNVIGCSNQPTERYREAGDFFSRVTDSFEDAVRSAHFVSLHIPAPPASRHYIDRWKLDHIPAAAWLINTSRGQVIDETALYDTLAGGKIAGAALDVFIQEPYTPRNPACDLRNLSNVILTPHVGSSTVEASCRMAQRAIRNVIAGHERRFSDMDLLNVDVLDYLDGVGSPRT